MQCLTPPDMPARDGVAQHNVVKNPRNESENSATLTSESTNDSEEAPAGRKCIVLSLIRHGQSESNVKNKWVWIDDLTDLGRSQAEKLGKEWADVRIDNLWTSTLGRAYQTADLLSQYNKHHPKAVRREVLVEHSVYGMEATEKGMEAVKLALELHGVTLSEPPEMFDNAEGYCAPTTLPDGVPHVVFVSHNVLLSELYDALHCWTKDHRQSKGYGNYDNTSWSRHILWYDTKTDTMRVSDMKRSLASWY